VERLERWRPRCKKRQWRVEAGHGQASGSLIVSKKFTGGNSTDTTAATIAYLQGQNELHLADLILIGELEDADAIFLTNWETPLIWNPWGTFLPTTIKRDKVPSQVGLDVTKVNLTWSPQVGTFTNNMVSTSQYQRAYIGAFDNKKVRIWRTVMPTPGDANTYGACEWFGGWIGTVTVQQGAIVLEVVSFLNVINQKVPPNVIESTNTLAGYQAGAPVIPDAETSIATFTVKTGSDAIVILGDTIQPTAHKIYGYPKLVNGFLVFLTGSLKGRWSIVATHSNFNAGGGTHYNQIQVYTPFPWDPTPGDTFYVATQPPINLQDSQSGIYQYNSFPYLPDPESNL
jgi:hypothetical protein